MGDEIWEFRGLVGDEGAGVGQIQAHRRVQESTSCPAVFVCLVSTRTESDLNLVPVHAIFRALPTTFGCANSLYRRRQWPLPGRRKHKRGVAGCWGCTEPASGCQWAVGSRLGTLGYTFLLPTDTLNASPCITTFQCTSAFQCGPYERRVNGLRCERYRTPIQIQGSLNYAADL